MSKILRRPMFRGGGKVSSYGNGIATGLADGGMPLLVGQHPDSAKGPDGREMHKEILTRGGLGGPRKPSIPTGGSIMSRIRNIPYLGGMIPTAGGTIARYSPYGAAIAAGTTLGNIPDFIAKSTDTPEGYKRRKEMGGANFNFDETNLDVGEIFNYIDEGNKIGEAPGFFPRGGKDKFYEEQGYLPDGTKIKVEEEIDDVNDGPTLEERIAKIQAEERKKYQDMIDKAMGTKDKRSAKEQIAENKELFEEVMGGGKKAMIDDLSTMGLSFASKALKEGATTKSAFAEFFEDESKRPSRKSKISDAASNAAIQAYLTGEKSYNDLMKALKVNQAGIDYKAKVEQDAKKALTVNDYVVADKTGSTNKAIANGARKVIENNNLGTQGLQIISKEDAADKELLRKENEGEVFMDEDNQVVFMVVDLGNGEYGKKYLYR